MRGSGQEEEEEEEKKVERYQASNERPMMTAVNPIDDRWENDETAQIFFIGVRHQTLFSTWSASAKF